MIRRPHSSEYQSPYYFNYIDRIKSDDLLVYLKEQKDEFLKLLKNIPKEKENYAYAEGKWTIKEVLGHCIDTERIMAYRAFSIARGEQQKLPGFDQDFYVKLGDFENRTVEDLSEEFSLLRESNLYLTKTFTEEMLSRMGTANNQHVSARAVLFVLAGHLEHHVEVLKEKYLV